MGSGYNLPDGCYESDLPGYYEVDESGEFDCPECGRRFTTDVTYDSKRDEEYEVTCDKQDGGCGYEWGELTPLGYRRQEAEIARDFDDWHPSYAQDHPRY